MYTHPAFRADGLGEIRLIIREARLSTLVTANPERLTTTPEGGVVFFSVDPDNPAAASDHFVSQKPRTCGTFLRLVHAM
ncbi:MAG: hypothetical protein K5872_03415 [Rhizobiaceae bacterium]|nr:hypothetical protein [Rhizobiaceae bacterium]MCV0405259.1 hypothetical protein [Rhizobiaceae bacterium]